jgi:hypothetical protein
VKYVWQLQGTHRHPLAACCHRPNNAAAAAGAAAAATLQAERLEQISKMHEEMMDNAKRQQVGVGRQ